jgi:hypothetical protein
MTEKATATATANANANATATRTMISEITNYSRNLIFS